MMREIFASKTHEERLSAFKKVMGEAFTEAEVDSFIEVLTLMGFFSAPASSRFHGDYAGGLFDHSCVVTLELLRLTKALNLKWVHERSPYVVGMFHDLCKCDEYVITKDGIERNKLVTLNGHGDKSAILAGEVLGICANERNFLTEEEVHCIRWLMGAYDDKENWGTLNGAITSFPNVLWTHTADMVASQLKGV